MYGRKEPPEYKLEEVTCPVLLFWGQKDWMAQPKGVAAIAARLPGLIGSVKVEEKKIYQKQGRHIKDFFSKNAQFEFPLH